MASVPPELYVYGGLVLQLVLTQVASAYCSVKTVDSITTILGRFYYQKIGWSTEGDLIGLYETIAAIFYLIFALIISIVGFIMAGLTWQHYDTRLTEAKNNGFFGLAFDTSSMYKYLALGMIVGGGAWIAAIVLGDSADKLLAYFDAYDPQ